MEWFYYALSGAFFFTVYSLLIKKLLRNESDVKIFNLLMNMGVGILLLLFSFFTDPLIDIQLGHVLLMIVASLMFSVASTLITLGRQKEEVTKISVVRQTALLWIFLGGVFVFNETISVTKVLGILSIVGGSVLALWQKNTLKPSKEIGYVFLATIAVGINSLISKSIVDDNMAPSLYIGIVISLSTIWLMIFLHNPIERMKKEYHYHKAKFIIPSLLLAGSMSSLMNGYKVGEVSQVYPVYSISLILTVVASVLFLKERDNLIQKIIGAMIVFCGIILIRLI